MVRGVRGIAQAGLMALAMAVIVPGNASAQSLKQTLIYAYENSRLLEQNQALLRATDEGAALAVSSLRPIVSLAGSASAVDPAPFGGDTLSGNVSLSARLNLFDGGDRRLGVDAAKETILATRSALREVEQQVLLGAAVAFFDVRKAATLVELQRNNLQLITRELQAAQDRFEVGEVTRTDVALAQARLAAVQSTLVAAEGSLARAREGYHLAVGKFPRALGSSGALPRPARSLASAKSLAMSKSPRIAQAQHEVKVAEINVARTRTAFRPTVDLSGSVSADDDGDTSGAITLTLNQTLYSGGQRNALNRQAIAQKEATRAGLLQTTLSVEQGVGNAWSDLNVANASLNATEEQVRASRLAFEGLREEASLGARTTLDVLDAEQNLLDAETNRANAVNDRFIAAYALMASMGLMTAEHLNLGIKTYDPADYFNQVKDAPRGSRRGNQLDKVMKALGKN